MHGQTWEYLEGCELGVHDVKFPNNTNIMKKLIWGSNFEGKENRKIIKRISLHSSVF